MTRGPCGRKGTIMTGERRQVLEMLAAGRITPADAEKLLDKLASLEGGEDEGAGERGAGETGKPAPRFFRIVVKEPDGDTVNVRIPLSFVRAGINLAALMPEDARRRMSERGIDLGDLCGLKGEALTEAIRNFTIDVEDGCDQVRIFCE